MSIIDKIKALFKKGESTESKYYIGENMIKAYGEISSKISSIDYNSVSCGISNFKTEYVLDSRINKLIARHRSPIYLYKQENFNFVDSAYTGIDAEFDIYTIDENKDYIKATLNVFIHGTGVDNKLNDLPAETLLDCCILLANGFISDIKFNNTLTSDEYHVELTNFNNLEKLCSYKYSGNTSAYGNDAYSKMFLDFDEFSEMRDSYKEYMKPYTYENNLEKDSIFYSNISYDLKQNDNEEE